MAEKVLKVGMDREDGFLYYIDKDGDIARVQINASCAPSRLAEPRAKKVYVVRECLCL
mgnify:CR=1 FL=1